MATRCRSSLHEQHFFERRIVSIHEDIQLSQGSPRRTTGPNHAGFSPLSYLVDKVWNVYVIHMQSANMIKVRTAITRITPYNVGSVLRRLFSTAEAIQYCGGIASVLREDSISTAEG